MKRRVPDSSMLASVESTARSSGAGDEREQELAGRNQSVANKCFLRTLHETEKRLNDAVDAGRQAGDLQQRVSRVYRRLYRPD